MTQDVKPYFHRELGETVMAIGGHYRFTDEVRMPFGDSELLYLKGYAVFDTTCCGAGGCGYAVVQGFIQEWKAETDSKGVFISRVRPVTDPGLQQEISRMIRKQETIQQVQFA